jgi:DNA-binding NarL/FixJ family response regulator
MEVDRAMEKPITQRVGEVDFPAHHDEPRLVGTIWIDCPYPLLSASLGRTLRESATRLHLGPKPPQGGGAAPSAVICHAESAEVVVSKVSNVKALAPEAPILVLSLQAQLPLARAALQAGAKGFIHAQMPPQQIVRALEVALEGKVVLPRELLKALVEKEQSTTENLSGLSPRKQEILGMVAEGLSNAQIARRSFLSESTIKQHLRTVYKVLGVKNRTEAAAVFRRHAKQMGGPAAAAPSPPPVAPSERQRRQPAGVPGRRAS